jgi:hypothetical protein
MPISQEDRSFARISGHGVDLGKFLQQAGSLYRSRMCVEVDLSQLPSNVCNEDFSGLRCR